jgi:hypothetical protein
MSSAIEFELEEGEVDKRIFEDAQHEEIQFADSEISTIPLPGRLVRTTNCPSDPNFIASINADFVYSEHSTYYDERDNPASIHFVKDRVKFVRHKFQDGSQFPGAPQGGSQFPPHPSSPPPRPRPFDASHFAASPHFVPIGSIESESESDEFDDFRIASLVAQNSELLHHIEHMYKTGDFDKWSKCRDSYV